MKIEVTKGEGLARELSVEVPADDVKTEIEKKLTELQKKVELKGFRKGKVPMKVIRQKYENDVKADVAEDLVQQGLRGALTEHQLKIAARPMITAIDFTEEGAFAYKADFEVFPEIEKVVMDGLKVAESKVEVEDKEVDDIIAYYLRQFATYRPLERPAEANDVIMTDLVKTADPNNALPASEFPDSKIDMASAMTLKEFKEGLLGVKAGDEKEIAVEYPEDYPDNVFAGAKVTYLCKIKQVTEKIDAELDDAFAKQSGVGETALEFRMKMRENITREKEDVARREQRRDLVDRFCDLNSIDVPEGMIKEYLDRVVKDFEEQGDDFKEEEVRENYRPVGIKAFRWDFLWRELVEQEKIEVSREDTEKWIKGFAAYNKVTVDEAQEQLKKAGKINEIRESLLEEKVIEFLLSKAETVSAN